MIFLKIYRFSVSLLLVGQFSQQKQNVLGRKRRFWLFYPKNASVPRWGGENSPVGCAKENFAAQYGKKIKNTITTYVPNIKIDHTIFKVLLILLNKFVNFLEDFSRRFRTLAV